MFALTRTLVMNRYPRPRVLLALLTLVAARPAAAQLTLRPAGVDLGLGLSFGRGGGLRDARDGVGASALVAWRGRPGRGGAPLWAVAAGAQGVVDGTDMCVLDPRGGCARNYPGFQTLGLLAGWEARSGARGGAVRALVGPAAFRSEARATALGVQGRLDLATPTVWHTALVLWGQGGLVPRLGGESYRMASVGLGLRVR